MPENKVVSLEERAKDEQKPFLEQLLQEGARKLLQAAIENEVIEYIQFHKDRLDENGQRLVVRNGHLPEREVISGAGPIASATGSLSEIASSAVLLFLAGPPQSGPRRCYPLCTSGDGITIRSQILCQILFHLNCCFKRHRI